MGSAARQVILESQGATERTLERLAPLLEEVHSKSTKSQPEAAGEPAAHRRAGAPARCARLDAPQVRC